MWDVSSPPQPSVVRLVSCHRAFTVLSCLITSHGNILRFVGGVVCLSAVIMAHLHPEAHILPVDIMGAMGALFCLCFFFNSTFGLVQSHAPLLILCIRGKF